MNISDHPRIHKQNSLFVKVPSCGRMRVATLGYGLYPTRLISDIDLVSRGKPQVLGVAFKLRSLPFST